MIKVINYDWRQLKEIGLSTITEHTIQSCTNYFSHTQKKKELGLVRSSIAICSLTYLVEAKKINPVFLSHFISEKKKKFLFFVVKVSKRYFFCMFRGKIYSL